MYTRSVVLVVASAALLLSCPGRKPEKEQPQPKAARRPSAPAPVVASTATSPPHDPLAARAEALDKRISKWGGDRAVLDEARKEATAILEIDRNYALAYRSLARIEMREGYLSGWDYEPSKLARADRLIQHAMKLAPKSPFVLETAAWVAMNGGYYDVATDYIERAEREGLQTGRAVLVRISLEERQGHIDDAIRLARAHEKDMKDPDDRAGYYGALADCYKAKRMPDEADAAFKAALANDPKSAWSHGNYARFLLDRERYAEGVAQAEAAVAILPYPIAVQTLYEAYFRRARELHEKGDFVHAGEIIEKVEKNAGENANASNMVGSYYLAAATREPAAGHVERAERAFRRALQADPNNAGAKRGLEQIEARRQHAATH